MEELADPNETIELNKGKLQRFVRYLSRASDRGGQMTKDDIDNIRYAYAWFQAELERDRDRKREERAEEYWENRADDLYHQHMSPPPNMDPEK